MPELIRVSGCDNPQRRGDVVFIHGLNGNPRDYWGLPGRHWPAWVGVEAPNVGVWSLGYENAAFKRRRLSIIQWWFPGGFAMPLYDRAKSVMLRFKKEGIGQRPVVFIAHSMGGLLIKELLRMASGSRPQSEPKTLLEQTRGVCFIATPHIGADLAKWVTYFRTFLGATISVDELRPHEPLLRELKDWYSEFVTRDGVDIKTLAFYEMKPMPVVGLVVAPGDADPGVSGADLYPIDEDHSTICTPQSTDTEIHWATVQFIRDCLKLGEAHPRDQKSTPASVRQPFDPSHPWNVPYVRNEFFTGRESVVTAIRRGFALPKKAVQAQAISGLGGLGKTQIAVEYAYHYRDTYAAVFWLDAESELSLKAGFGELARLMKLPHRENDLDQAVLAFKQWLATEPGWLLIFDNADLPAVLKPFLPLVDHGHVLITSRAQDFQDLGILNPVELKRLTVAEGTAFLLDRCRFQDADQAERAAAAELAGALDGLPLALEQAAAYIIERKASFRRYLETYRIRGLKLFEARSPAFGQYNKSVPTVWLANFEAVEEDSPAAADVLRLSAFLAPEAIPFWLLIRGAPELGPAVRGALMKADHDPLLVNDLLGPLGRFSLIQTDGRDETYSIHRLVQMDIEAAMGDDTRRLWCERAIRAVAREFPDVEYKNWPLCGRLLPHALAALSRVGEDCQALAQAGLIHHRAANYLHARGQYAQSERLYLRAKEIRKKATGQGDTDYGATLNDLAELYRAMGRLSEAEPLYLQAKEIRRKALGERHADYAATLNDLAELYRAMGRHAEAERLYLQATEIRRDVLGERHPDYAASLNNLAELYRATGRLAEAEPLYVQAKDIVGTALGEQHPYYAALLNNLAELYLAMGHLAEAEPLYVRATEIYRSALGDRHPHYATLLNNLAELYREMGRLPEAEPLYKKALEIRGKALGEQHPEYAASLNNLAACYRLTGRQAEALPLQIQATKIYRTALGERHAHYAASLNNLAGLYRAMRRYPEAEPLAVQATDIFRTAVGEGHADYATSLDNLAQLYRAMGRPADAEPLFKKAKEIRKKAVGERHSDYAASLHNLAELYSTLGRLDEAEPLYVQAVEIRRTALGEHHPDYVASMKNLAELRQAMVRQAEAEPLVRGNVNPVPIT